MVESSARLSWEVLTAHSWKLPAGNKLDLQMTGPREVRALAERAAQSCIWTAAAGRRKSYQELTGTPLLEPLAQLCKHTSSEKCWGATEQGWLRSLVADSWHSLGNMCTLCGCTFSQWHAVLDCPAVEPKAWELAEDLPSGLLSAARSGQGNPMFHHLLVNDPGRMLAPPLAGEKLIWTVSPGWDACFEGSAFGDGSGICGESFVTRRCGFAVAGGWVYT